MCICVRHSAKIWGFQKLISPACFYHPGPLLWVFNIAVTQDPVLGRAPMMGLMVYCHCLNMWPCVFISPGSWKVYSWSFCYHRHYCLVGRQMLEMKKVKEKDHIQGIWKKNHHKMNWVLQLKKYKDFWYKQQETLSWYRSGKANTGWRCEDLVGVNQGKKREGYSLLMEEQAGMCRG